MNCPGGHSIVGATQIYTATSTQTATITFYFDGTPQMPSSTGTTASYTTPPGVSGVHTIKVTVSNANGSSEASCNWIVDSPIFQDTLTLTYNRDLPNGDGQYISDNLVAVCCSNIYCQKCQLPDLNWAYVFDFVVTGVIRKNDPNHELPDLMTGCTIDSELNGKQWYLGAFDEYGVKINKISNNNNQVLFMTLDPYCLGITHLPDGNFGQYLGNLQSQAMFIECATSILSLLGGQIELLGTAMEVNEAASLGTNFISYLLNPPQNQFNSGTISYDFPMLDLNASIVRLPDCCNYARWFVLVINGSTVQLGVDMKLYPDDQLFEENRTITIQAGQNPSIQ